tara:strand:- start:1252 stop:1755 length:504 start_codon:yes stop_codon:yes gene_type:complete
MGQEFIIKSQNLEDKVNQLLPSQGGFQAGVDLSASTTIIPIVDLTESAEGSSLRVDLQTALSHNSATVFSVQNADTTVINTTGYWRIFGNVSHVGSATGQFVINDGATDKILSQYKGAGSIIEINSYDFIIKLEAGDSFIVKSNSANIEFDGSARQLADVNGNLVNP